MLLFHNWLRSNASDHRLYELTKQKLAHQNWKYTQHYADATTKLVEGILERATRNASPEH